MTWPGAYDRSSSQRIINQGFLPERLATPEPHQVYVFGDCLQELSYFVDGEPFRVYLCAKTLHLILYLIGHLVHALYDFVDPQLQLLFGSDQSLQWNLQIVQLLLLLIVELVVDLDTDLSIDDNVEFVSLSMLRYFNIKFFTISSYCFYFWHS